MARKVFFSFHYIRMPLKVQILCIRYQQNIYCRSTSKRCKTGKMPFNKMMTSIRWIFYIVL